MGPVRILIWIWINHFTSPTLRVRSFLDIKRYYSVRRAVVRAQSINDFRVSPSKNEPSQIDLHKSSYCKSSYCNLKLQFALKLVNNLHFWLLYPSNVAMFVCLFVCLFVCSPVNKITQKVVDRFSRNVTWLVCYGFGQAKIGYTLRPMCFLINCSLFHHLWRLRYDIKQHYSIGVHSLEWILSRTTKNKRLINLTWPSTRIQDDDWS